MAKTDLRLTETPVATAAMLIRRPAVDVFEAFVNPARMTTFWFTKNSGRLEPGANVRWEWEMSNASTDVRVEEIVQNDLARQMGGAFVTDSTVGSPLDWIGKGA